MNMLFKTPIGLLSLFTITFIIGMAIYLFFWIKKQVENEENQHKPSK